MTKKKRQTGGAASQIANALPHTSEMQGLREAYGLDGAENAMRVAFSEMEGFKAAADRQALVGKSVADALSPYQNAVGRIFEQHREIAESLRKVVNGYSFHNFDFDRLKIDLAFGKEFQAAAERFAAANASAFKGIDFDRLRTDHTFGKEFQAAAERLAAENASAFKGIDFDRLKTDQAFGKEFQAAAERLEAANASAFKGIDLDLSVNIGDLLARSLAAQEALLEEQRAFHAEQREGAEAARIEARFHRRIAYFFVLSAALTLFLNVAMYLEAQEASAQSSEQAEATRVEIIRMRESFELMSQQLEELQEADAAQAARDDAEAAREAAADAELVGIMRDIADGLRNEEKDTDDD